MDSDDYTTDEAKRKRDDEDEAFKKSKKIFRTPKKGEDQMENMIEKIMKMIKELSSDVKVIKEEQHKHTKDMNLLRQEIKDLRVEQGKYREEIKDLKVLNDKTIKEVHDLKKELNKANERIEKMEREKRRRNISLQGLHVNANNQIKLRETMEKFMEEKLDLKVHVNTAKKVGENIFIIEMNSEEDKYNVMKNKSKLKNIRGEKVYINDDMTKPEREIQKIVRIKAKEEREKGKKVKEGFQKLIIDGTTWKWNNEKKQLDEITHKNQRPKN